MTDYIQQARGNECHDTVLTRRSTNNNITKSHVTSSLRVEQLSDDNGVMSAETSSGNDRSKLKLDTLAVPDVDANDSSDGSSMLSPRSDDAQIQGATDDESIAVNCHTNPSEVIVKGKNVKQIRVKFPPHPPKSDEATRKMSGRNRFHRSHSGSNVKDSVSAEEEKLPYPQEETSLPAITESVGEGPGATFLNRQESCISLHSHDLPFNQYGLGSAAGSSRHQSIDWDLKYKQDILAGLDYFERRGTEFNDLNNRAIQELERLKQKNQELEELVYKLQKEKACLLDDSSELKIKLDQAEKENQIIQNQAVSQWQERVDVEEKYMELQRDTHHEINSLKDRVLEKEKEINVLKATNNVDQKTQLIQNKQKDKADSLSKSLSKEAKKSGLSDDNFELLHNISRLQDEIKKLNLDKDALSEKNGRLRQDVTNLKTSFTEKSHELDSQFKRFLALKKSYNDLDDEHKKLRMQLRGRSMSQHHVGLIGQRDQSAANTTWPASNAVPGQNKPSLSTVELESVSYIDLPKGTLNGLSGTSASTQQKPPRGNHGTGKATKTSQKRNKTEVINLTDNLPPVPNHSR